MRKMLSVCVIFIILICLGIFCLSNKKITIDENANGYLKHRGVSNYSVVKKKDYTYSNNKQNKITVSESEIQDYIKDDLESYDELIDIDDRNTVKKGDFVTVDITRSVDGHIIESGNEIFKVGANYHDKDLEEKIIGSFINKKYIIYLNITDDNKNEYSEELEKVEYIIEKIQYMKTPQLNMSFVKENYNLDSVEDYYEYVKELLKKQKTAELNNHINNEYMNELKKIYDISIDDKQLASYAVSVYDKYIQMAENMGYTIDEFSNEILKKDINDFYDYCFDGALSELKEIIAVGAYASENNIKISYEDYKNYIHIQDYSGEEIDGNEEYIYYEILKEEVLKKLIE